MASAIQVPKSSRSCPTLGEHLLKCSNVRKKSANRGGHRNCSQSLASFNTEDDDWSTNTEPISNTVKAHEEKKNEKRRFLMFTQALLKFLEKKNPALCKDARAVIQRCGGKKKEGEYGFESLCDSLRAPLKETVGSTYWREAKWYLKEMDDHEYEPISLNDSSSEGLTTSDVETLSSILLGGDRKRGASRKKSPDPIKEEKTLRRKRLWMLIRVLMKYIQNKDAALYAKARAKIEECAQRKERNEERFTNLPESVQRELKRVVGIDNWRRAESYMGKLLIRQAEDEACDLALAREAGSFCLADGSFGRVVPTNENMYPESIWSTTVGGPTKSNQFHETKKRGTDGHITLHDCSDNMGAERERFHSPRTILRDEDDGANKRRRKL